MGGDLAAREGHPEEMHFRDEGRSLLVGPRSQVEIGNQLVLERHGAGFLKARNYGRSVC